MTATKIQPVAEICSASHDDAQFGERDIKLLRDISGFEYGTPLYAGAAPAAVAPQGEYPHEQMDAMALARYKVVPSHASMLWSHAVVAGHGAQQLYVGREVECQNMARKFAGAFLDGAFAFHSMAAAPTAQAAPALEAPAAPAHEVLTTEQILSMDFRGTRDEALRFARVVERAVLAAAPQAPAWEQGRRELLRHIASRACDPALSAETVRAAVPVEQCTSQNCADAYLKLADAMGYDSGKDGIEWSPEEWAAHLLAAYQAAPAAPAGDASDTALLDAMERHRIALVPEHEGPWDAELYEEGEEPQHIGSGATPREALRAAIAAQAKEGGA